MALPEKPITRVEHYLNRIAGQSGQIPDVPFTRIEHYLDYIARNGGGGGGDTIDPVPTEGSTNAVSSGGVYDSFHDLTAADVKVEASGYVTETGNPVEIETSFAQNASELSVALEPAQDLHGYDKPWSGGNGKNKFVPPTTGSTVGITYTFNSDGTFTVNGTATGYSYLDSFVTLPAGNYILSGGGNGVKVHIRNKATDEAIAISTTAGDSNAFTLPESIEVKCRIQVTQGTIINNLKVYPMLRLATETDPTFEPYSNICPIYPANGKNLFDANQITASTSVTYTISGNSISIETDGTGTYQGINFGGPTNLKFQPGTYYVKFKIDRIDKPENTIRSGFRNSQNYFQGGSITINSTGNYAVTLTIGEPCYFSVFLNGPSDADKSNALVISDIIISTNDVPFVPYQGTKIDRVGKNLLPNVAQDITAHGVTFSISVDGSVILNGTATGTAILNYVPKHLMQLLTGSDYIISCNELASGRLRIDFFGTDVDNPEIADWISIKTGIIKEEIITLQREYKYYRFNIIATQGQSFDNVTIYPMIRSTSVTDPTFEPYSSTSLTLNLGRDVYGGTVDVVNGILTVDKGIFTIDGENIKVSNSSETNPNGKTAILGYSTSLNFSDWDDAICDRAVFAKNKSHRTLTTNEYTVTVASSGKTITFRFVLPLSSSATADEANAYFEDNPYTFVYPLATPQTYTLTPQQLNLLKGYNRISGDGIITIGYQGKGESDVQTELDEHSEKLRSLDTLTSSIAPVETSTASANYAVGDYLMFNGSLCKVTSAIATGETITIGSNVTVTTVTAELLAIIAQM